MTTAVAAAAITPSPTLSTDMQFADSAANQDKVAQAGRIPRIAFIVSLPAQSHVLADSMLIFHLFYASMCFFFAIAVTSAFARFVFRLVARRRFYLDDMFFAFALLCLGAGTALMIEFYKVAFLDEAVATNSTVIIQPSQLTSLFNSLTMLDAFFCIMWTATFSIKASFLALFRQLIQRVSKKLRIHFWVTAVLTFLAWAYFECEDFIVCHYFGAEVRE